jgi:hypothetical protein
MVGWPAFTPLKRNSVAGFMHGPSQSLDALLSFGSREPPNVIMLAYNALINNNLTLHPQLTPLLCIHVNALTN